MSGARQLANTAYGAVSSSGKGWLCVLFAVVASEGAFDAVLCGFPVALPSPLSSEQLAVLSKALKPGSKLHLQEQGNTAHSEDGATLSFGKREGSVCCP